VYGAYFPKAWQGEEMNRGTAPLLDSCRVKLAAAAHTTFDEGKTPSYLDSLEFGD
jgi:hypothetical protein